MQHGLSRSALLFALIALGHAQVLSPGDSQRVRGGVTYVVVRAEDAEVSPSDMVIRKFKKGRYVHFRIKVERGPNTFQILYLSPEGEKRTETRTVISFPSSHNRWGGKRISPHPEGRLTHTCKGCHNFDLDRPDTCGECHTTVGTWANLDVVHSPVEEEDCASCHEKPAITREVCEDCHDFDESVDHPHAPFGVSDCSMCHDPHATRRAKLLRSSVRLLCSQCHDPERYQEGVHPVSRHPMESEKLTCASCHSPHGTPYRYFLITDPSGICDACHEDQ